MIRSNRHRPDFKYGSFKDRVFLGNLSKKVKDGLVTKEQAHDLLHLHVPHLLGANHQHHEPVAEPEVVELSSDELVEEVTPPPPVHVHGKNCNHNH